MEGKWPHNFRDKKKVKLRINRKKTIRMLKCLMKEKTERREGLK